MASATRSKLAVWIARHLSASGLTLVGVLLLLGYAFVFRPQIGAIRNADRVALLTGEHDAKTAYLKQLDALDAQYASFAPEDRDRLYQMIPRDEDVPGVLAIMEAAAVSSDAQLTAVNFGTADTSGLPGVQGVSAINVAISLQHVDYPRFKLFLEALETNLRLFDVRSANIDPSNASYSMTIRAYLRSETPSGAAAPPPAQAPL